MMLLKGDRFKFADPAKDIQQWYVVVDITKADNDSIVHYRPEITPVANSSMFRYGTLSIIIDGGKKLSLFEYSGQGVSIVIQARDQDQAFLILKKKLEEEGCDEVVLYTEIMDISNDEPGVVALFQNMGE